MDEKRATCRECYSDDIGIETILCPKHAAVDDLLSALTRVEQALRTRGPKDWFPVDVRFAVEAAIAKAGGRKAAAFQGGK